LKKQQSGSIALELIAGNYRETAPRFFVDGSHPAQEHRDRLLGPVAQMSKPPASP
jgi:hypothetical protein